MTWSRMSNTGASVLMRMTLRPAQYAGFILCRTHRSSRADRIVHALDGTTRIAIGMKSIRERRAPHPLIRSHIR